MRDFAAAGELGLVTNIGDDVEEVTEIVDQVEASGLLDKIGVDPSGIGAIVDAITGTGMAHDRIVGIPQGWRMVGSIKTTERRLAEGALWHGGSGLMAWAVSNARVELRGNNIIITKQMSGSAKIDPLMALLDAAALMSMNPQPRAKRRRPRLSRKSSFPSANRSMRRRPSSSARCKNSWSAKPP